MPWKVTDPMNERLQFLAAHQDGLFSMTELCQRFAISRKTGYKWIERYQQEGLDGLKDQSHATRACPHQMPPQVQQALLDTRKQHPTWGPKKLLPYLAKHQPELALPAASTVGDLLERQGLTSLSVDAAHTNIPARSPW